MSLEVVSQVTTTEEATSYPASNSSLHWHGVATSVLWNNTQVILKSIL